MSLILTLYFLPVFLHVYPHRFFAHQEEASWGAEQRIDLRPALQQAHALYQLSYTAPWLSYNNAP
jgi:hypothetical protein